MLLRILPLILSSDHLGSLGNKSLELTGHFLSEGGDPYHILEKMVTLLLILVALLGKHI